LDNLQRQSFSYFLNETNPDNGLVIDKTAADWPASIAATGFALAAYPVAVERGFMARAAAVERTLTTLRFFWNSPQGPESDATGYQGFYYHFLDMRTGRRAWNCELSTMDSTFLLAGALTAECYFDADTPSEKEIRNPENRFCNAATDGAASHWAPRRSGKSSVQTYPRRFPMAGTAACWLGEALAVNIEARYIYLDLGRP